MYKKQSVTSQSAKLRWNLAGVAVGITLLILLSAYSGATFAGIMQTAVNVTWQVFVLVAILQGLIVILAAFKWRIVLAETLEGKTVPIETAISATANGALLGQVISIQVSVPIVRAWAARRYDISLQAASGASLFEQSLELLTLGLAATASLALAASGDGYFVAILIFCLLLIVVTQILRPLLKIGGIILDALPLPGALARMRTTLSLGLKQAGQLRLPVLRQLMAISLVRYIAILSVNIGILVSLEPTLDLLPLIVAFPLILVAASLPFLPAGLGAAEVSWVVVLLAQGVPPAEAAKLAIAIRIVSLAAFFLIYPFLTLLGRFKPQGPPD